MKTNFILIVLLVFGVHLVSCAGPSTESISTEEMIHHGDTVSGMTFGSVGEYEEFIGTEIYCDADIPEDEPSGHEAYLERHCQAVEGDRVWINCMGMFADTLEELDEIWEATDFTMTVDGRTVDLTSFGTMEEIASWDNQARVRAWNVEIENLTAGRHDIVCGLKNEDEDVENHLMFDVQEEAQVLNTLPAEAAAGQHAYTSEAAGLDFLLYIPEAYDQGPTREWPLILFLHGFIDGIQNIEALRRQDLQDKLEQEADFPFIVVSPLRTGGRGDFEYWFREEHTKPLFRLVEEVSSQYSVDPDRVYLSGGSAGGNGVWEIGIQYPDRFAALVPVMGYYGYPFEVPDNICDLKDVPVWAFHGALDETVPLDAEQSLIDALNDCGGQAEITIIPDIGHDLTADDVYTPELTDWLLSQSLE
jgi:pimeloyl-ACP methyl ester carboxylesterase